jgi:cell division protein FtsZ
MQERIAAQGQHAAAPAAPPPAPSAAETAATAAVAAALEDVTIRPIPPKPTLFEPAAKAAAPSEPAMPKVFIPPQAEKPAARAPRMPRIDEFPPHAQDALRAREAQASPPAHAEDPADKPRMSLLARLASVGLGRREEAHHDEQERATPRPQMPPLPERPRPAQRVEPVSEYAKRGVPQGLDQHGRPAPVHNHDADDQLEIPAFLRRQAK